MKIIKGASLQYLPASHEDPHDPEVFKKVLISRDDLSSGRIQMINWAKLPRGKKFKAHYHQDMQEIFIVMSGKAKITVEKESEILERGDAVVIPSQKVHTMESVEGDAEYIVIGITTEQGGKTVIVENEQIESN